MQGRTIFTGFSPNTSSSDVRLALTYLLLPWKWTKWKNGSERIRAERTMQEYFDVPHAFTVDSGRSALFFALQALGIRSGDEVLVQAYTCVVVINAIRYAGGIPVYVDVDDSYCMDPEDARKKWTPKAKVIIIQHTFGHAANLPLLLALAKEKGMRTIEDCAHVYGGTYQGRKLGTFADIAMLSFGSDKAISSVRGGALIMADSALAAAVKESVVSLPHMPASIIFRHLLHYPVFYLGRLFYGIWIGKFILAGAKRLGIINMIIEPAEKKGKKPRWFPAQYPNVLAALLLHQMQEIEHVNMLRKERTKQYHESLAPLKSVVGLPLQDEETVYLRYTIRTLHPEKLCAQMKQKGVLLGNWYDAVVAPKDSDQAQSGYIPGSCKRAETFARQSVNLPTDRHIGKRDGAFIIDLIHTCLASLSNK